jgi:ABC-type Zn uptake system ZnuABC Zn-binding protein ZnuA
MRPSTPTRALGVIIASAALGLTGCAQQSGADDGRLAVVATTTQLGDFARSVGGDRIALTRLLPPNADPHEYEPTPSDVQAVAEADVVLEHGLGLDDWLDQVVANAGGSAARTVTSTGVATLPNGDPHIWLDPANAIQMVGAIQRALAAADPPGADTYRANARSLTDQITALDRELERRIARIPVDRRKIVTDHDAFGYFARRYGIDIVGTTLPSLSTAAQPSAKQLAELAATIRAEMVRVVFAEASIDPRVERALAEEAGARLGAPLYADALGPIDSEAGTYLGMMRANMDAIIAGVGSG